MRRSLKAEREPLVRATRVRWIEDGEHHAALVQGILLQAAVSVWIATANVKDMQVEAPVGSRARAAGRYISVLDRFTELAARGVELRLLHGAPPSRAFTGSLGKRAALAGGGLQMRRCPRVHLKMLVVDGRYLYLGSANFTGAGLGAKGEGRRNFEAGFLTEDDVLLDAAQARFERIWTGADCAGCRMRKHCPAPLDALTAGQSKPSRRTRR